MGKEITWMPAVDPEKSWQEGWGHLARIRAIFGATIAKAALAAILFLWSNPAYGIAATVVFVATTAGMVLYRRFLIRWVHLGINWHEVAHFIRDESGLILQATSPNEHARYQERYRNFHGQVAERVAIFFRCVCADSRVCCAIRLADTGNGLQEYVTVGRSTLMDPTRNELTEPVRNNEGICEALRKKASLGVIFIRDIKAAIAQGWWKPCKTDDLPDVKTLLIAPINGYILGKKSMLGILYVTSPNDAFRQTHAEPLKAFADLLGAVYPLITGRLVQQPPSNIGKESHA
jgi:hypothetical protein